MSTNGQVSETAGIVRHIRPVAISVLIGAIFCALVLLLESVILSMGSVPQVAVGPMASIALVAGGFVSGFCCARIHLQRGLAWGAICGAALTLIVLIAGLSLRDNAFGVPAMLKIALIMLPAMIGGVLGVNGRRRRK